jgi:hypothetical protein
MYTSQSLALTRRASRILELIEKANDRIDLYQQKLYESRNLAELGLPSDPKKMYAKLGAAKEAKCRLIEAYGSTVLRIVYHGLKQNAFEYLDKPLNQKVQVWN